MPLNPIGLNRYDSAPDSFLSNPIAVSDDVNFLNGRNRFFHCLASESTCNAADPTSLSSEGSYGMHGASYYTNALQVAAGDLPMSSRIGHGSGISSQLSRHSSSPAEFPSDAMVDNGVTVTSGGAGYSSAPILKTQLSFSSRQNTSISHTSEISTNDTIAANIGQRYMASNYQIGSWDGSNSFVICGNDNNGNMIDSHTYNLSNTPMDMANVENLFQIQKDNVPCKIRAKRGCATHPRSIAERERRTRISEKLRKLQEFVPNMDKQTSTADMLDLAVQHIKGLQSQIQTLNEETANCTCSSKQDMYM